MVEAIDAVLVRAAQLTTDGRPRAAIGLLRPLLATNPRHSAAWCRLSVAYLDTGELDESLDAAKQAIRLGERSWAHRLASLALVELGRFDEAVASAREAVRREPSDWRCHVALAESLVPTVPTEALTVARRAVDLAPQEARPHEVLGDVAVRLRDAPLARRAYRDALRLDPDSEAARAGLSAIDSRTAPPKLAKQVPARPRFGRVQRTALWLLVRRVALWFGLGAFLLLIAGLPDPSPLLAWFGFALLLFVFGLAGHGWLGLPPGGRVGLAEMRRAAPLILTGVIVLGVAALALVLWTIALSLGSRGLHLLNVVLGCCVLTAALGWVGLWRLKPRTR